jgi:hypothetical protein
MLPEILMKGQPTAKVKAQVKVSDRRAGKPISVNKAQRKTVKPRVKKTPAKKLRSKTTKPVRKTVAKKPVTKPSVKATHKTSKAQKTPTKKTPVKQPVKKKQKK